jgi:RNA polymerase sigma-70 factor (ECF subfamily)
MHGDGPNGRQRVAIDAGERDQVASRFLALADRLTGTAYYLLGHREDARDAVQEAFVRCFQGACARDASAQLDAWIFTVVLNTARDLRRRRVVRRVRPLPTEETMHPATREPSPDVVVERQDALERVRAALHALPEAEREVFLLRQNGDLTYEAIAASLHAPVGTVKTRMRAALRRLREAVDRGESRMRGAMS